MVKRKWRVCTCMHVALFFRLLKAHVWPDYYSMPMSFRNYSNLSRARGFVKTSAICSDVGIYLSSTVPVSWNLVWQLCRHKCRYFGVSRSFWIVVWTIRTSSPLWWIANNRAHFFGSWHARHSLLSLILQARILFEAVCLKYVGLLALRTRCLPCWPEEGPGGARSVRKGGGDGASRRRTQPALSSVFASG